MTKDEFAAQLGTRYSNIPEDTITILWESGPPNMEITTEMVNILLDNCDYIRSIIREVYDAGLEVQDISLIFEEEHDNSKESNMWYPSVGHSIMIDSVNPYRMVN